MAVAHADAGQRKEILRNQRVTISLLELALREATPMHRHDSDMLAAFIDGGPHAEHILGAQVGSGQDGNGARRDFWNAGYAHTTKNDGASRVRVVIVEFADPQGEVEEVGTA